MRLWRLGQSLAGAVTSADRTDHICSVGSVSPVSPGSAASGLQIRAQIWSLTGTTVVAIASASSLTLCQARSRCLRSCPLSYVDRTPRSSVRDSTVGRDHYRFDRVWVGPLETLPGRVIGAKPAAFRWIFTLLGAVTGDMLGDLFFGSGAVGRAHQLAGARAMGLTYPWVLGRERRLAPVV